MGRVHINRPIEKVKDGGHFRGGTPAQPTSVAWPDGQKTQEFSVTGRLSDRHRLCRLAPGGLYRRNWGLAKESAGTRDSEIGARGFRVAEPRKNVLPLGAFQFRPVRVHCVCRAALQGRKCLLWELQRTQSPR